MCAAQHKQFEQLQQQWQQVLLQLLVLLHRHGQHGWPHIDVLRRGYGSADTQHHQPDQRQPQQQLLQPVYIVQQRLALIKLFELQFLHRLARGLRLHQQCALVRIVIDGPYPAE